MNCLNCLNLDLQTFPRHSATGFGKCKFEPVGHFSNITKERDCNKFAKADDDVITKRNEWALKVFGIEK